MPFHASLLQGRCKQLASNTQQNLLLLAGPVCSRLPACPPPACLQQGLSWTLRMPTPGPNVVAAQLQHRVPCWGYVFQEEPQVVPPPAAAAAAPGTGSEVAGAEGGVAGQQWVRPGRKLVILGDTCNSSSLAPLAADCDLLSHEATFCSGMEDKAAVAQHSTTEQAGAFAAAVDARNLVLTHFSAR